MCMPRYEYRRTGRKSHAKHSAFNNHWTHTRSSQLGWVDLGDTITELTRDASHALLRLMYFKWLHATDANDWASCDGFQHIIYVSR